MFVCQEFPAPFGEFFNNAQVKVIDSVIMKNLLSWMQEQQEKGGEGNEKLIPQLKALYHGYTRLMATPRGKQFQALEATQEILESTEKGRREKRVHASITALAKIRAK